jgi:hypothetical protein
MYGLKAGSLMRHQDEVGFGGVGTGYLYFQLARPNYSMGARCTSQGTDLSDMKWLVETMQEFIKKCKPSGIELTEERLRGYEKGRIAFEMVKPKEERLVKPSGAEYMCFKCRCVAFINNLGDYECACRNSAGKHVTWDSRERGPLPYGWGRVKYVIIEVET